MDVLKYMLLIIIIFIVMNLYSLQTSTTDIINDGESLGFVKPEHKLYKIFSKISSGSKIKLNGKCTKYIYNKNTIDEKTKGNTINLLKKMINTIKHISNQDYLSLIHI